MKISIIGSGLVGATAAYALVMRGIGREIVLVDLDIKRAEAEADDILHAVPFAHPLNIIAGTYEDIKDSRLVIITAGVAQRSGETRLQLLERNVKIFNTIIPQVYQHAPKAIVLVTTNPVDIMTHVTAKIAEKYGVPASRVLGSGTMLDTARFRALLGLHLGIDAQHIHAYVVGEHGDSEVLTWSMATVGGTPLVDFASRTGRPLKPPVIADIDHQVRHAAYKIIDGKGATYYGIGSALARISEVILGEQQSILTVCSPLAKIPGVEDVTLSLPFLVGADGILNTIPFSLHDAETHSLIESAKVVKNAILEIDQKGL